MHSGMGACQMKLCVGGRSCKSDRTITLQVKVRSRGLAYISKVNGLSFLNLTRIPSQGVFWHTETDVTMKGDMNTKLLQMLC